MTVELMWNWIKLVGLGIIFVLLIGVLFALVFVVSISIQEIWRQWSNRK